MMQSDVNFDINFVVPPPLLSSLLKIQAVLELVTKTKQHPKCGRDLRMRMFNCQEAALRGEHEEVKKVLQEVLNEAKTPRLQTQDLSNNLQDQPKWDLSPYLQTQAKWDLFQCFVFYARISSFFQLDDLLVLFFELCKEVYKDLNDESRKDIMEDYVQYCICHGEMHRRKGKYGFALNRFEEAEGKLKICVENEFIELWIDYLKIITTMSITNISRVSEKRHKDILHKAKERKAYLQDKYEKKEKLYNNAYLFFLVAMAEISFLTDSFNQLFTEAVKVMDQVVKEKPIEFDEGRQNGDPFWENFIIVEVKFQELQIKIDLKNPQEVSLHKEKLSVIMNKIPAYSRLFGRCKRICGEEVKDEEEEEEDEDDEEEKENVEVGEMRRLGEDREQQEERQCEDMSFDEFELVDDKEKIEEEIDKNFEIVGQ